MAGAIEAALARQNHQAVGIVPIEAATGTRPEHLHLWLGSGTVETLRTLDFAAYWKRLRARLALVLDQQIVTGMVAPKPCDHCPFCEFAEVCGGSRSHAYAVTGDVLASDPSCLRVAAAVG